MTSNRTCLPGRPGQGLVLIGYRGTGKSTVGRIVADRLNRKFLDADLEIEARAGRSIRSIFTDWGETVFRDWEEQILAELTSAFPDAVVATGGGVVLREINRRRIRGFGLVVWLRADPTELARRLESDERGLADRPALTLAGTLAEIAQVLEDRIPLYQELADTVMETGGKTPDEVAAAILRHWHSRSVTSI
jgi:shikimate kinase